MKTIIYYASKTGTTEKCALLLSEKIPGATVCNLKQKILPPSEYDVIIVGGSVRMGNLNEKARKFLQKYEEVLLSKKFGLFICNGIEEATANIITRNFKPLLLEKSFAVSSFGGELDITKQKGFDKFVVSQLSKDTTMKQPKILMENIEAFAREVNSF